MKEKKPRGDETLLAHLGRDPGRYHGVVNMPVFHASTVLYDSLEDFESRVRINEPGAVLYGRMGTPDTFALEAAVAELEGGADSVAVPSGLAAISCALLALVEAGDHILVSDSVYKPARTFCDKTLARLGVETSYFDPTIADDGIAALVRTNTRLIYAESPGSLTFEMQDLPALGAVARTRDIPLLADTTWATPLHFKPFAHGVDISIQAGTKYLVGHSDAMLGMITSNERYAPQIRRGVRQLGVSAGTEEIFLGQRGLRTLAVRLARHQETGLALARWLEARPEVAQVLHPALPSHPGHAIWRRDFTGACGLFSIVLRHPYPKAALSAMIEGLELFGLGASWGGYESLLIPADPTEIRTATAWQAPGPLLRIHAGLEAVDDLIADLAAGFERLEQVAQAAE
ncbi:MAG: cystathionine beta-lyase [Kiloniellales bacterium]|nr:cystathionine beta-lyase [Kiloniellales bacterium]